nr:SprT family zinc-dependent metalloprotease [Marinicella rhabdoformis]
MRVLKPDGQVRVSVPYQVSDRVIEQFVLDRLDWIESAQAQIKSLAIKPEFEYKSGEWHQVFGEAFKLVVLAAKGKHQVLSKDQRLYMYVGTKTTTANRKKLLNQWYRDQLLIKAESIIEKWQPIVGKQVAECRIKNMKTRWGTCHIHDARIWLSLSLAQYPVSCVEYIVVHEMTHLHERLHNKRFHALMDGFMPDWRERQLLLNHKY